ncbi:uncharacterized protein LOC135389997 isoform X2 [Ornithodoros turicata]|uniref:uncharacterized protein LOC135389997 isoform X2 n=1 Tax=Ornithodoros turicata TaxID=34597 RepID=UPI00313A18D6
MAGGVLWSSCLPTDVAICGVGVFKQHKNGDDATTKSSSTGGQASSTTTGANGSSSDTTWSSSDNPGSPIATKGSSSHTASSFSKTTGSSSDTTEETSTPAPDRNLLMCTLGRALLRTPFFRLPDGLCSMVVLRGYLDPHYGSTFSSAGSSVMYDQWLKTLARGGTYNRTRFGLDIFDPRIKDDDGIHETAGQLSTPAGRTSFETFFKSGFVDFGILGAIVSHNTPDQYIDDISDALAALRAVQADAANGTETGYIFLGVAPLYGGNYGDDSVLISKFHNMIRKVTPDIVLFRTTAYYDRFQLNDCKVTAPSLWDKAPLSTQPTFVDSLRFQSMVSLPRTTKRMLSFSLSKRLNSGSDTSDIGSGCVSAYDIPPYEILCNGSYLLGEVEPEEVDKERSVAYQRRKDGSKVLYYDTADTTMQKMCKATANHGFRGGWVLFDLDYGGVMSCTGVEKSDGFALVHAVEANMRKEFESCPTG